MNSSRLAWLALIPLLAVAACDPQRDPDSLFAPGGVDIPVIDALLVVNQPLPRILLTRTQPPDQLFSFQEAAIREADVWLTSELGDTVQYTEVISGGIYDPQIWPALIVQPETTYHITVTTDRGERITASTTTPARFSVLDWVLVAGQGNPEDRSLRTFEEIGDLVYDAPENQLVYPQGVLETRLDDTPALGFQLAIFSLDPGSDFVIDPPFFDEEDFAALERSGSSPVFGAEEGMISLPWFAIYFEGRYKYKIQSLDLNTFDLVRSTPQGGFGIGGNAGDNFELPIYHVEGGIGLFGSVAVDSVGFRVLPAP